MVIRFYDIGKHTYQKEAHMTTVTGISFDEESEKWLGEMLAEELKANPRANRSALVCKLIRQEHTRRAVMSAGDAALAKAAKAEAHS